MSRASPSGKERLPKQGGGAPAGDSMDDASSRDIGAPDPSDAANRLQRLLHIIPAACREGGASIRDLAEQLGVHEKTIAGDLGEVIERGYRLKAGSPGDLQVTISGERVRVWSPGDFMRPARLSPRETLALGMGLRMAALSPSGGDAERRENIRRRLEAQIVARPSNERLEHFRSAELGIDPDGIRETISLCARDRRRCCIRYLKPGSEEEERVVRPHVLVHAEGWWYLLGYCESVESVRAFRMDRIVGVSEVGEPGAYPPPADFKPADWFDGGRVFQSDDASEVRIRYSSVLARAVAEQREGEWGEDGSLMVRYRVADTGWLVRHVLEAGGEAEVMEPPELRLAVVEAARRVLDGHREKS